MNKKLSQKEEGEVVTKGFLVEHLDGVLDSREYLTKNSLADYLEEKEYITRSSLEEVLDSKNYVTKEYAHDMFETFQKNIETYITVIMEDNNHKFQMLIEAFNGRFERIERHV